MKPYRLHVFVCQGKRCLSKGSEEVHKDLKEKVKAMGLKSEIKVTKCGCLGVCKATDIEAEYSPAVIVYPEGIWYRNVTLADVDELIEKHLLKGEIVERLLYFKFGAKTD